MEGATMILKVFIYTHNLQQKLSDSTQCARMHFPSALSCARIKDYDYYIRLQLLIPSEIYVRHDRIMKKHLHLLLDFNQIFPHSASRMNL